MNASNPLLLVKGTLAPSGTLTIVGNLALNSTATTLCNVTPGAADMVTVSETATVGGRLSVTMSGTFTSFNTRYTLFKVHGTLTGTFSNGVSIKYPTDQGFTPQITYDYDGNHVYLDLIFNE
jgi:hypothetical protein